MLCSIASPVPAGVGHLSSRGIVYVEQAVYVVVRAEAIRQVTEREYPVPDPSPVVLARREMHGEPANLHGGIDI